MFDEKAAGIPASRRCCAASPENGEVRWAASFCAFLVVVTTCGKSEKVYTDLLCLDVDDIARSVEALHREMTKMSRLPPQIETEAGDPAILCYYI